MKLFSNAAWVVVCSLSMVAIKGMEASLESPLATPAWNEAANERLVYAGENSFVINGGGFYNQTKKATNQASLGWYDASNKIGHVNVGSSTDAVAFTLQFQGNAVGTYEGGAGNIQFYDGKNQTSFYADRNSLTVIITRYDAPGGLIEGRFSGRYSDMSRKTTVTITDGKFSVIRRKDE